MNEHELQLRLTKLWTTEGVKIQGRCHFLVAWEVMSPSWRINDAGKYWTEPSADFLVADEHMRFTVIELKSRITGVKPCWLVLSQVTHRAVELGCSISKANLEQAYSACWSGAHGRIPGLRSPVPLAENHRRFFKLKCCAEFRTHGLRRCVAAPEFGPSWPNVLRELNQLNWNAIQNRVCEELTSKTAEREVKRLTAISTAKLKDLISPVMSLQIESSVLS